VRKPGYQTAKIVKFSVEMGNAGLARATKHTLTKGSPCLPLQQVKQFHANQETRT
jgi:hypothetical protein